MENIIRTEEDKIIERIKKLLSLGKDNPSENEAESAMLMAQSLMAKYNLSVEISDEEIISYSELKCVSKWDMGFRKPLGHVISDNFRCRFYLSGGSIVFVGRTMDARIAKEVFEYAYAYALKEGNRMYNRAYSLGLKTTGVFNSYTLGFIEGMKEKLGEQSTALKVITPPDVNSKFAEITEGFGTARGGMRLNKLDGHAYGQGKTDGRTVLNGRQIEA